MCFKLVVLTLACLGGLAAQKVPFKGKRQVDNAVVKNEDHAPAESGDPAAAIHAGSKYFQDIYVAMEKPNELQFGHVSETPKAWEQRFEKINLDNLKRQGKVRWGDKHGGYGEHYWDYNHDGNQESARAESQLVPVYDSYEEESQYAPAYVQVDGTQRGKREQGLLKDVEFINDKAKSLILDGNAQKHGGNYRSADDDYRGKREQHKINGDDLVYKPYSGRLFDRRTGQQYELKPVYSDKEFDF